MHQNKKEYFPILVKSKLFVIATLGALKPNRLGVDKNVIVPHNQCDQIGRFFALWATFLKPLATINSPKSLTFLGIFCKGVKIFHFCSEIIFGQLL